MPRLRPIRRALALLLVVLLQAGVASASARAGRRAAPVTLDVAALPTMAVDGASCTLHDAILAANAGTTVGGCTGSPGLEVLSLEADVVLPAQDATHSARVGGAFAALPEVTSGVVLVAGAGSVIQRAPALGCDAEDDDSFRLFNVTATGALYLVGLTLRNGCVAPEEGVEESEGGAIHVDGGVLELVDVTFERNVVVATANLAPGAVGGAIYCLEGTVRAFGSTFDDNHARGIAGAEARGGAVRAAGCGLGDWSDVVFTGNSASGGASSNEDIRGGALSLSSSSVESMRGTSFLDNLAEGLDGALTGARAAGGALDLDQSAILEMVSVTFRGNQARGGNAGQDFGGSARGGALFVEALAVVGSIETSVFGDNVALGGEGGPAAGRGGEGRGGALSIDFGARVGRLRDTLFADNLALGGAALGEGPQMVVSTPSKGGSQGGRSSAFGGAVDARGAIDDVERVTWAHNRAEGGVAAELSDAYGGALFIDGAVARIVSATFYANRAQGGDVVGSVGFSTRAFGGALHRESEEPIELVASTFARNEARAGAGPGGSVFGGALSSQGETSPEDSIRALGNLFDDNVLVTGDGVATPNDCVDLSQCGVLSLGYNVLEAPGGCAFAFTAEGDRADAVGDTFALASWGCTSLLADGSCLPTVAIDQSSPAIDGGSCSGAGIAEDARETPRPFDFESVADAVDGCDAGAFEAVDADGDGYSEAVDCFPFDPSAHAADACGVCEGDGTTCILFSDGFESGDATAWPAVVP